MRALVRRGFFGALSCAIVACVRAPAVEPAPSGIIRINGSPAMIPLAAELARAYRASNPSVTIQLGTGLGGRARIDTLARNGIDIALASAPASREDMARLGLTSHEVARSAVVFAVNASVSAAGLTQQQVCDAFSGSVSNWRQLGSSDLAIAVRTRPAGEVDADVALAGVPCLKVAIAKGSPKALAMPEEMATELSAVAGAIGMTSMPFVEQSGGRMRALALNGVAPSTSEVRTGRYPLTRAAIFLARADASPATRHFIAFARSTEGARIIAANGGVPAAEIVPVLPADILGEFTDDYGITYSISRADWFQRPRAHYQVVRSDTTAGYVIARNAATNPTEPGLYTRFDWIRLSGMAPFEWAFCMIAYDKPTADDAELATTARRDTPRTGCNGHPFSRMKRRAQP